MEDAYRDVNVSSSQQELRVQTAEPWEDAQHPLVPYPTHTHPPYTPAHMDF